MSLILDALRKLDREKEQPERGLVVVGAAETPGPRGSGVPTLALALILGGALGGAFALLWLRGAARPPASAGSPAPSLPASAARPSDPAPNPRPSVVPAMPAPAATPAPADLPGSASPLAALGAGSPRPSRRAAAVSPSAPPQPTLATTPAPLAATPAPGGAVPADAETAAVELPEPPTDPHPRPAPSKTTGPAELRLEAISEREGRPVAILSGRLVFEGDSFDGIRVLHIGASEVEIERDGKRQVLRF